MKTVNKDLMEAAKNGDKSGLKALLFHPGCDPTVKDVSGMTALMRAAWNGHIACVKLLLPVGDVLAKDNNGGTALMCAALNENDSCVQLLIPVSDVLAREKHGRTASELARSKGHTALGDFMDAYTLALGERSALHALTSPAAPRSKASLRV